MHKFLKILNLKRPCFVFNLQAIIRCVVGNTEINYIYYILNNITTFKNILVYFDSHQILLSLNTFSGGVRFKTLEGDGRERYLFVC